MNFKLLWNLARLYATKAPEAAMEVIRQLDPKKWHMTVNGVAATQKTPKFRLADSFKQKRLVFEMEYSIDGVTHSLRGSTLFKNDSSDTLVIDGVSVTMPSSGYNLTTKPLRSYFELKMPYTSDSGAGEIKLWNDGS